MAVEMAVGRPVDMPIDPRIDRRADEQRGGPGAVTDTIERAGVVGWARPAGTTDKPAVGLRCLVAPRNRGNPETESKAQAHGESQASKPSGHHENVITEP